LKYVEKALMHYSLVGDEPIFQAKDYSWTKTLESHAPVILKELKDVLKNPEKIPSFHTISKDQVNISKDDRWKTFFLYGYGYKMDKNCELCPETTRVLESIPGMFTGFYSVLAPGKHIPPHKGPYRGVLRCHLALIVPEPSDECWIQVGDQVAHWK
jgi:beta-hydroxylase